MFPSDTRRASLLDRIYNINDRDFDTVAMEVWHFQYEGNELYRAFCQMVGKTTSNVNAMADIPFMPVAFFRDHEVKTGEWEAENIFRSSGTTGMKRSHHAIRSLAWYHRVSEKIFEEAFGKPSGYTWIALLPSYLERNDSSLIDMVHYFIHQAKHADSQFHSSITNNLLEVLSRLAAANQPTILIGVSFALVDLFSQCKISVWDQLYVIETGGMKGRKVEITREELYVIMRTNHSDLRIGSEYGMTELLSQAYRKEARFYPGFSMKVMIRDISDPLELLLPGQRGAICIIDLANLDTCSFIATDDIGILYEDGSFDVLGRVDQSDVRGCSLMYAQ